MQLKDFSQLSDALKADWRRIARPNQLAPDGDWLVWLILAGRGWGKSLCGAQWIRNKVINDGCRRVALVGATAADCSDVMVEDQSGILSVGIKSERPTYSP